MIPEAVHVPMRAQYTRVYLANLSGGFDVSACPDPEKLAAFIESACNHRDRLIAMVKKLAEKADHQESLDVDILLMDIGDI